MRIISHRGYWKTDSEKNMAPAFSRSFSFGFGTETDLRDYSSELVISHDMANGTEMRFEDFLKLANSYSPIWLLTLALNIKSDGLASHIYRAVQKYEKLDYFVFDMSIPDLRSYLNKGIPVFTRMSEVEQHPVWIDQCDGIWLDGFETEWFSNSLILNLLNRRKRVCIVSPELHKRSHLSFWERIKPIAKEQQLMLCTDFPEEANNFFNA